jgi:hypothetical protein
MRSDVQLEPWVSGPGGIRGPRHLVDQVAQEFTDYLAAVEQGLPVAEQQDPLITTMFLFGFGSGLRDEVRRWIGARRRPRPPAGSRGEPILFDP